MSPHCPASNCIDAASAAKAKRSTTRALQKGHLELNSCGLDLDCSICNCGIVIVTDFADRNAETTCQCLFISSSRHHTVVFLATNASLSCLSFIISMPWRSPRLHQRQQRGRLHQRALLRLRQGPGDGKPPDRPPLHRADLRFQRACIHERPVLRPGAGEFHITGHGGAGAGAARGVQPVCLCQWESVLAPWSLRIRCPRMSCSQSISLLLCPKTTIRKGSGLMASIKSLARRTIGAPIQIIGVLLIIHKRKIL